MLKDKIAKYVGLLIIFRVQECVQELLSDSIGVGIECVIDYGVFQEKMDEYIQRHRVQTDKEQLEALLNDIGQDIYKRIRERDLYVLEEVEKTLVKELENGEIRPEIRGVLKEDLMCQLLLYTKNRDVLFYNQLIARKENQQNINAIEERLLQLEKILSAYLKHKDSPLKEYGKYLHIDNTDKIDVRTNEIEEIKSRFQKNSNILFLYGRPGIGKTTLARLYAREFVKSGGQVFFEKYEKSIEYTVRKLAKNPEKNSGQEILSHWKNLEVSEREKVLLIIDNFNEDTLQGSDKEHFNRELRGDFYKQLIDLGIKILITTRINVDNNVYTVKAVEETFELFVRYSGLTIDVAEENRKRIEKIILTVRGNTLLLVLVARIWSRIDGDGKDELISRLNDCRLVEQVEMTTVDADIDAEEDMTIYEQVSALLDFSGILSDTETHKVFANVALLPNEGMSQFTFKKLANCQDDNSLYRLIRNSWMLNDCDNIYVHPVVREIAFRNNLVRYELCHEYCRSINDAIRIELSFEERFFYKIYAEEIYSRFAKLEELDDTLVNLFYRLSAIYDALAEPQKSMEIINRIRNNIEKIIEEPVDKARMLSGIAFSLNNCFDSMNTLEQARRLLDEAMQIAENDNEECHKLKYVQTYGRILSNYGSNSLAKSKCNQDMKTEYLKEAVSWHEKALRYRECERDSIESDNEEKQIINGEVATSYTTIATDYFYLEQYDKAIEYHQKAYYIRESLVLEREKNINSQRIIGSVLAWYRKDSTIGSSYIELALSYYPKLLQSNFEFGMHNVVGENLHYFIQLVDIVKNDNHLDALKEEVQEKGATILEWLKAKESLLESFKLEIDALKESFI